MNQTKIIQYSIAKKRAYRGLVLKVSLGQFPRTPLPAGGYLEGASVLMHRERLKLKTALTSILPSILTHRLSTPYGECPGLPYLKP